MAMGNVSFVKAICLLSGGLDSATALAVALMAGYDVKALTIHYGQIHKREIRSAEQIARHFGVERTEINFTLPWGGSALLDPEIPLPKNRNEEAMIKEIPASYVPARNTIFLSLAASFAEASDARAIFIGANAIDYSGYPDCRGEYFKAFEEMIARGTKCGVEGKSIQIMAPLLHMKKSEIIRLGLTLRVPYELTWSCYEGKGVPCNECDSCVIRQKGFQEAGAIDPLLVQTKHSFVR